MIAAVYARKSTEQIGVTDDQKSVARQVENARTFATAKGWTVADAHVYSDDAVSGAERKKLVARQRLLDLIASGRAPFQVLILRDDSRFSRADGDVAVAELKRIVQAGIAVWFYQDGTQFTYGAFSANVVAFVRAEMNAEYRRQSSKLAHESAIRKAKAGHVTGGACFGYDNVRVNGHVERRINEPQAKVIRRIFALCAKGNGYARIAKLLNAEGVLAPQPRKGRPAGWGTSTIYEVLHRPRYKGVVFWNQTRRRAADGTATYAARPKSEWIRVDQPELAIVSADAWNAAHQRLETIRARLTQASNGRHGRRRDIESKYLLSGFARCAVCGGSIGVLNRSHGHRPLYGCIAYHKRGTTVCRNALKKPVAVVDDAVRQQLAELMCPKAWTAVLEKAIQRLAPPNVARDLRQSRGELHTVEREIAHLTTAIAKGGQLTSLLDALTARHARREDLITTIARYEAADTSRIDRAALEREVRAALNDWRAQLAAGAIDRMRQALREILVGPLTLTPDGPAYRFEGESALGLVLLGRLGATNLLSAPPGAPPTRKHPLQNPT